ncbi:hypothetical protein M407DRAFT_26801 [Tulasnella calospora MUT 4182]|uniref:Uncharacterized protein n=1 Tax=Tulasnella calospora MUT 4182 TaxID=1051891 RepID=A0A0C3KQP6_9AGAM|nr:hypothetical protein M407DRAFT_26801 [Tulasnella calospora MUT 4182]
MSLPSLTSSAKENTPNVTHVRGSSGSSISRVLASFRDNIRAAQRRTQSLVYNKPVRRYTRLVMAVHERFKRRTEQGYGPKATTLVDDGFEHAQVDRRGPKNLYGRSSNLLRLRESEQFGNGWKVYTNPEGDNYFRHEQRHLVTYINVRAPSTEQCLLRADNRLVEVGRTKDPQVAECEAYIHIVLETSVTCQVEYYFIDGSAQHPFWVHDIRTRDRGLPDFETPDHLKAILIPEFWVHIEYFAVHQKLEKSLEDELIAIFRHGCAGKSFGQPPRHTCMLARCFDK